MSLGLKSKH